MTNEMQNTVSAPAKVQLDEKKVFKSIFWRQFQLLGCMSHTRMQGIGFGWTLAPTLKMIYKGDHDKYMEALKRESMFFNTTQALAPFIMGLAVSMEKENAENPDFDTNTINGIKCGLMGPFAGIGDTFFYSTLRVIITSLVIGLALNGNVLGPILYLLLYNIPNYLIRYFGMVYGYRLGSTFVLEAQKSGLLECITKAASIVGLMMIGCMTYSMVSFKTTLSVTMAGPAGHSGQHLQGSHSADFGSGLLQGSAQEDQPQLDHAWPDRLWLHHRVHRSGLTTFPENSS